MIVSKIYGGIGNQLFMYAFGLSESKRLNTELKLDTDILIYNPQNFTPYDFELGYFKDINEEIVGTPTDLTVVEQHVQGREGIQDNSLLDGYWQGEEFFEDVKDELRDKLLFKEEVKEKVKNIQISDNSVFIHARRGDYLNGDYFVDLSKTDYYQKAVEYILDKTEAPTFYIFSNDVEWAKTFFQFVPGNKQFLMNSTIEDLYLMSCCKHSIIANSTYSWWAAWLNKNPDKIVIQPNEWYGAKENKELFFKDSIKI